MNPRDTERLAKWQSLFSQDRATRARLLVPRRPASDHLSRNSLADPVHPRQPPAQDQPPAPYYPSE